MMVSQRAWLNVKISLFVFEWYWVKLLETCSATWEIVNRAVSVDTVLLRFTLWLGSVYAHNHCMDLVQCWKFCISLLLTSMKWSEYLLGLDFLCVLFLVDYYRVKPTSLDTGNWFVHFNFCSFFSVAGNHTNSQWNHQVIITVLLHICWFIGLQRQCMWTLDNHGRLSSSPWYCKFLSTSLLLVIYAAISVTWGGGGMCLSIFAT